MIKANRLDIVRFAHSVAPSKPVKNEVCLNSPCQWHLKPDEVSFSGRPKTGKPNKPNQAAGKPSK